VTDAHNEKALEDEIAAHLAANGWLYSPTDKGYDRQLALFPEDVFAWLEETQPDQWAKVVRPTDTPAQHEKAKAALLTTLTTKLGTAMSSGGGTLNVIHDGFAHLAAKFKMAQAKPTESLNPTVVKHYAANRLRVMRQVHYSTARPNRSIDLVLFLNGLPVATIELKTEFTQSARHGEVQYAASRLPTDPGTNQEEPLLTFGKRALVYFVVTNTVVSMTTKLDGSKTTFLPFNKGNDGKKGNPVNPDGSDTAYFWTQVLERDQWLKILTKYMLVRRDESIDPVTGKTKRSVSIRFPRYHQLAAVEAVVADAFAKGVGQRYLIEHSAGSGKTDTIVWTAHRLAALHDANNKKMFDSVIIVTDRTVLDDQMGKAIVQLDHKTGQVKSITSEAGSKSKELTEAIAAKTPIIVVTIQTAPFALAHLREAAENLGGRFAVIADEAHSSQTGNAAATLRKVLSPEEQADLDDGGEVDAESILAAEMTQRATTPNISFLAFTATPKPKTMELFGRLNDEDKPESFHVYTMRQAIEEKFILDVLVNYTPYKVAFKVAHNGEDYDSDKVDKSQAMKSVMRWVRLHPHNISQKVQIIVEHFRTNVSGLLGGSAKAMVVTGSRKEAVRYHAALNKYIEDKGYDDLAALVAFSGAVDDPETHPKPVTETSLNPGAKGRKLDVAFNGPEFQVLIVANKYQVGFDQPLLTAMYVDKRLAGVMAVQTLSRLNRTWPGKDRTYVLDFVNDPAEILESFKPYYEGATMVATTDPNLVHQIAAKLDQAGLYDLADVEAAAKAFREGSNGKLSGAVSPAWHAFNDAKAKAKKADDKEELDRLTLFRTDLDAYVRAYEFLSQIFDFENPELEKRNIFYKALSAALDSLTDDDQDHVSLPGIVMTHYKVSKGAAQKLDLDTGEASPLAPLIAVGGGELHNPENAQWSEILDAINELFAGTSLTEGDLIIQLDNVLRTTKNNAALVETAQNNTNEDFYQDLKVITEFLAAVLTGHEANVEFTDTLLKNQDHASLVKLLQRLGFREYLAGKNAQPGANK
jgi:type I restriction enzyme, R subunit